ncbi:uncharacterized protein L3040_004197 [Drepanopeziza brunnea f. sp. 'multigermtubi']|uniref:uncharacterized protein n=1 Tax=Drepanopeziza brunnea f. sp. 'multigermtubi' TaxID=698441 RepID=UPI002384BFCC|nr:hypothetical protein L3040_004197 [Drepanopeziza brunnea f. sp. 'multigermtubi']
MNIPTDTINDDGELELWAQFWKTPEELKTFSAITVVWMGWKIAGESGSYGEGEQRLKQKLEWEEEQNMMEEDEKMEVVKIVEQVYSMEDS